MTAARLRHSVAVMAPAIETNGLTKVYGDGETEVRALDGVDLRVDAGEFVALMGPSGSGKSTLLHIVGGLESPTSGTLTVAGVESDQLDERELTRLRREHIGFVFQFFNLLGSLTAVENIYLPALIGHRREPQLRDRAHELLRRVDLGERGEHFPAELSGGEQQRVSIARALLLSPEILLADEPTGNLDSRAGGTVLRLLRELSDNEGRTVLMVTHDPSAAAIADRVLFLHDGHITNEVPGGSTQRIAEVMASLGTGPVDSLRIAGGTAAGAAV